MTQSQSTSRRAATAGCLRSGALPRTRNPCRDVRADRSANQPPILVQLAVREKTNSWHSSMPAMWAAAPASAPSLARDVLRRACGKPSAASAPMGTASSPVRRIAVHGRHPATCTAASHARALAGTSLRALLGRMVMSSGKQPQDNPYRGIRCQGATGEIAGCSSLARNRRSTVWRGGPPWRATQARRQRAPAVSFAMSFSDAVRDGNEYLRKFDPNALAPRQTPRRP